MPARRWRLAIVVGGLWLLGRCALAAAPVSLVVIEAGQGFSEPSTAGRYIGIIEDAFEAFGEYLDAVALAVSDDDFPSAAQVAALPGVTHRLTVAVDEAQGDVALRFELAPTDEPPVTREFAGAPDRLDLVFAPAVEWLAVELGCGEAQLSRLRGWLPTAFPRSLDECSPPTPPDGADAGPEPTREYGLAKVDALPSDRLQRLDEVFPGHAGVRLGDTPPDAEGRERLADEFAEACAAMESDGTIRTSSGRLLRAQVSLVGPLLLAMPWADYLWELVVEAVRETAAGGALSPLLERGLLEAESQFRARVTPHRAPDLPPLEDDLRSVALASMAFDRFLDRPGTEDVASPTESPGLPLGANAVLTALLEWKRSVATATELLAPDAPDFPETPLARISLRLNTAPPEVLAADCAAVVVGGLTAPERAGLRTIESWALLNCGRYEDALTSVRGGLAADRGLAALWARGWGLHLMRGDRSSALGAAREALAHATDDDERAQWRDEIAALEAHTLGTLRPNPFDADFWADDDRVWFGASLGDVCVIRPPADGDARGTVRLWCWSGSDSAVEFDAAERVWLVTVDGATHEASPTDAVWAPGPDSEDGYTEVVLRFPTARGAPSRLLLDAESTDDAPGERLSIPYRPAGGFEITGYAGE